VSERNRPQKRVATKKSLPRHSRQRVLENARESCVSASRAVGIALDAPEGSSTRDELTRWARQSAVKALEELVADRFWALLAPNEEISQLPAARVVEPDSDDIDEVRDALVELVGNGLSQVLLEVGYQPPPPHWEIVADARRAAVEAVTWSSEVDYALIRRQLRRLITALTILRLEGNEEAVRQSFLKAKQALVGGGFVAVVLMGQVVGVLDDARQEVLYPAISHVWGEIIDRDDRSERPPVPPAPSPELDYELREVRLAIENANLREAKARAQIAEMELVLMRERVDDERTGRDHGYR
jgi:hypothetical protein